MSPKPRTPQEIAKTKRPRKTYSFSLDEAQTEKLSELAKREGVPLSELIDEAIKSYLEAIKE
jgi:predicted DNA-binding protein